MGQTMIKSLCTDDCCRNEYVAFNERVDAGKGWKAYHAKDKRKGEGRPGAYRHVDSLGGCTGKVEGYKLDGSVLRYEMSSKLWKERTDNGGAKKVKRTRRLFVDVLDETT